MLMVLFILGGERDMGRIYRLCRALDNLQARCDEAEVRHHQRYRMKTAARRIRLKIRNLVDELHKRCAKWLCENFRCVLIPRFDVSQMVKRGKRKIRSKTARAMLDMGTLPLSTAFAVCLKVVSTHGAVSL